MKLFDLINSDKEAAATAVRVALNAAAFNILDSLTESQDAIHPAGQTLLKHIKPEHHDVYKPFLQKKTFNGSYADRSAVLNAAKTAGHLISDSVEETEDYDQLDEAFKTVPTHLGSGKPNPNHPAFATHQKKFEEDKAAVKSKAGPRLDDSHKVTRTHYHTAFDAVPDMDPHDIITRISRKLGISTDHAIKGLNRHARDDGNRKGFTDAYYKMAKDVKDGAYESLDSLDDDYDQLDEAERKSTAFKFTHIPGDEESEKKLADLKAQVAADNKKGDSIAQRVLVKARLGKNNPNAFKYSVNAPKAEYKDGKQTNSDVTGKAGSHSHQSIKKADAKHFDVYVHNR